MKIIPNTTLGKWSLVLLGGSFLLVIFTTVVVVGIFQQEGGETFTDNLYISIPMLISFGLAVATLIAGATSILRDKERALLVYLATATGLLVTIFAIAELIAPH